MASNGRHPLLLPEISRHIGSLSPGVALRLAYTCKTVFHSVIPALWEEVYSVERIMALIPGVKFVSESSTEANGESLTKYIVIDETALNGDWSRYWYYAPLVKCLRLFTLQAVDGSNLLVRGWHILFLKLRDGALLPNLRVLNITGLRGHSSFDRIAWFALFLSPSLRKLDLNDGSNTYQVDPRLPTYPLYLLLAALNEGMLGDTNTFLSTPYRRPTEHTFSLLYSSKHRQGYSWFSNLPDLTGLRKLGITVFPSPETVRDALYITGHLPFLERLQLGFITDWDSMANLDPERRYDCSEVLPLPSNLFPSLRKLNLSHPPDIHLYHWMWSLKPLTYGLLSARVDLRSFDFNPEDYQLHVVRPLRENSPSLTALSVFVSDHQDRVGGLDVLCGILSLIPLKELKLRCIRNWGSFPAAYSGKTFPHLRRLIFDPPFAPTYWHIIIEVAKILPKPRVSVCLALHSDLRASAL
ncbi:unnamed protein product [Rhizoctonia solani]|uniref:Uncharacterized protein n=1 Tax=Rhizoctonia solani TaxID=456999 RepID=A0A8H3CD78_9AGAM|nr:unnamed protein product [Rhizoctonia solani]